MSSIKSLSLVTHCTAILIFSALASYSQLISDFQKEFKQSKPIVVRV